MNHRLVIAEKPSVAKSIAYVLGAHQSREGYLEGNGWYVSWCVGHLAGLADADHYDPRYKTWNYEDLPILPRPWKMEVRAGKQKQFSILKQLLNDPEVTEVVNACDAGREGELIFRSVYALAGCKKPIKRLWISSMEDSAIRAGFSDLHPGAEFEGLYQAALCRAKADWLVGINATRLFSVLYNHKLNIGRVMSPTLAMIVQRESEISAFQPEPYYTVKLNVQNVSAVSEKFRNRQEAEALAAACKKDAALVQKIQKQERQEKAPALYDLTTLQREANRALGYTAQQTLDYLQSLYEKKLCTYPRTDSRYLTDDMESRVMPTVHTAAWLCNVSRPAAVLTAQVCNSKKVTDHHAILPTKQAGDVDLSSLPAGERNILTMVARQVLMAISEPFRWQEAEVTISCGGGEFHATLKKVMDCGWKQYCGKPLSGKTFEGMAVGQTISECGVSVEEGATQPPKHFTEDTLLSAMETAGREDMPEDAERKGIGTPATRAGILEKLVSAGFLERRKSKKAVHLIPSRDALSITTVLPEQLQSPLLTAEWEYRLKEVEHGELSPEDFMAGICGMVEELVKTYQVIPGTQSLFTPEQEIIGTCPRCCGNVAVMSKGFFCQSRDCQFGIWKNNKWWAAKRRQPTKAIVSDLLRCGRGTIQGCYSERTGRVYDAEVVMEDDGSFTRFKLVFGKDKSQ